MPAMRRSRDPMAAGPARHCAPCRGNGVVPVPVGPSARARKGIFFPITGPRADVGARPGVGAMLVVFSEVSHS